MPDKKLTHQRALELIHSYNVEGSQPELQHIINVCEEDADALEIAATTLRDLKGGDAGELGNPEVLTSILKQLVRADKPALAVRIYHEEPSLRGAGRWYTNLGRKRGRFRQGLELTECLEEAAASFDKQDTRDQSADPESGFPSLEHERALFLIDLGQLTEAERILRHPRVGEVDGHYPGVIGKSVYQFVAKLNLCDVLTLTGRLHEAHCVADMLARAYASNDVDNTSGSTQGARLKDMARIGEYANYYTFTTGFNPHARRAWIRTLQGHVEEALLDFKRAEVFQQEKLDYLYKMRARFSQLMHYRKTGHVPPGIAISHNLLHGDLEALWIYSLFLSNSSGEFSPVTSSPLLGQAAIYYGLLLTRLGKLHTAFEVLDYNRRWAAHSDNRFAPMVAFADVALSDVLRLQGNIQEALQRLEHPLAWAAETGQKEIACWAHLSLARAYLYGRELDKAQSALQLALEMAREHHLVLYEIDGQVTGGWIAFLHQDWKTARRNTIAALTAAADPACGYAWAHGNALHLLAKITAHPECRPRYTWQDRTNTMEAAERMARSAVNLRERIRDPRLPNSQRLLTEITTQLGG